jgi:enoyl-CoA hydratase/carnithine racemase
MPVEYKKQGNIAIITMNRPEARNAINAEMASTMEAAIDQMESDPEVWLFVGFDAIRSECPVGQVVVAANEV